MAQLKERDTDETVDGQLIPEEVERLRELGVEVENSDQDEDGGSGDGGDSGESDEDSEEESSGSGGSDGEQEGDSPDEEESGGSGGEDDDSDDSGDDVPDNSGLDADDLDELEQESDIAGEDGGAEPDDLDEQVKGVKAAGGGNGLIRMDNFESTDYDSDWESTGSRFASQLGGMLVDHFRQERRSDVKTGQRSGRFDSNKLISADRGSPRVFKSENKPDEKKYHAVIAMDDSGSMWSDGLEEACVTTGMLVQALEEVGIVTTVYRFARSVRLVKSPTQSYDETKDKIFQRDSNGGTRLLPAIEQAEEIAKGEADETFLVVITDGKPADSDKIKEKLDTSHLKSITVQIGMDHEEFRGSYDGWVYVENTSDVPSKTQSAFRRVML